MKTILLTLACQAIFFAVFIFPLLVVAKRSDEQADELLRKLQGGKL